MAEEKKNRAGFKNIRFLLSYIAPYKWVFIIGLISLAISTFAMLAIPKVLEELVNGFKLPQAEFNALKTKLIIASIAILAIQAIFSFIRTYTFTLVTEKGMGAVRKDLYNQILKSKIEFFDQTRVGELLSRLTSDVVTLQDTFSIYTAELIRQFITILGGIVLLFLLSWELSLYMLLTLPIFIGLAFYFGRFIRKFAKEKQTAIADSNVYAEEAFGGIRVVKAFNQTANENKKYGGAIQRIIDIALHGAAYRGAFISFVVLGLFGVLFLIFFKAAALGQAGIIDEGKLVSFVFYTGLIGGSIAGLGNLATQFQKILGSTERIVDILKKEDELAHLDKSPLNLSGGLTFSNVQFSYPSRKEIEVLKDITFHVKQGETVALVGQSGAGKSTIFQLLLGFYNLDAGNIFFDNYNASEHHPENIRANISVVPQEVVLFGGTIAENIAYGKPEATEEEIMNAAKEANALEFIQTFPEGLNTLVGERGIKLSGGQRQRIAIARAILKNPALLLLDEATSSLDAASEQLIQSALDNLTQERTTLIIAHRLSTIRNADRILVLNNGEIVESGSHEELIQNPDGLYTHLQKLQYQVV